MDEIHHWFGEDGTRLRSFAMVALRTQKTIGLWSWEARISSGFYPEMGTVYLTRLSELVSAALGRLAAPARMPKKRTSMISGNSQELASAYLSHLATERRLSPLT